MDRKLVLKIVYGEIFHYGWEFEFQCMHLSTCLIQQGTVTKQWWTSKPLLHFSIGKAENFISIPDPWLPMSCPLESSKCRVSHAQLHKPRPPIWPNYVLYITTVPVKALEPIFALFLMGKCCRTVMKIAWLHLEFRLEFSLKSKSCWYSFFCCLESPLRGKCKRRF